MSEENDSGRKANRRTVLKSLGAATALSTAGVSVSGARGKPTLRERVDQSHRILQAAGPEKQHEFLRNHGVATAKKSTTAEMPVETSDGPSTEVLTTGEITLTFSLYNDCGYYGYADGTHIAELTWEYNASFDDWGASPKDYVGIGWDDNTWYYEDNNESDMDSNSSYVNYKTGTSGEGPVWEIRDEATLDNGYEFDGQDFYWVNVDIDWTGPDYLMDNRTIAASYCHTWSDVKITGVGVSYPAGVSVSVGNENEEWTKDTNDDGDFLRLRYNDLGGC